MMRRFVTAAPAFLALARQSLAFVHAPGRRLPATAMPPFARGSGGANSSPPGATAASAAAVAVEEETPSAKRPAVTADAPESPLVPTTSHTPRKPQSGDVVTVDVQLTPREGFVPEPLFDSTGRISFVLDGGNYLPGLHELTSTLLPGESVRGVVLDAGWGERRDDLIAKVPKEKDGGEGQGLNYDQIEAGTELFLANGMKCTVTEVTEEDFTIDANPPLAGASFSADVELVSVEEGPTAGPCVDGDGEEDEEGQKNPFGASRYEVVTIALGCFWGGELEYMRVPGVVGTKVGYTQGDVENPSYQEVCSGTTGHTEAIQVVFDPDVVGYEDLVRMGMERLGEENRILLNQVGNDRGTQYRHGVYFHTKEQGEIARRVVESYGPECKTEVLPAKEFYDAEDYHQQYLLKGGQSARKGYKEDIRCYG